MYVCMHVYVCMYMYVCLYGGMQVNMNIYICVCVCVCVCACVCNCKLGHFITMITTVSYWETLFRISTVGHNIYNNFPLVTMRHGKESLSV